MRSHLWQVRERLCKNYSSSYINNLTSRAWGLSTQLFKLLCFIFFIQLHLGLFGLQGGHKSQKSVTEPQAQQIGIAFFHHALLGKLIEPLNISPNVRVKRPNHLQGPKMCRDTGGFPVSQHHPITTWENHRFL